MNILNEVVIRLSLRITPSLISIILHKILSLIHQLLIVRQIKRYAATFPVFPAHRPNYNTLILVKLIKIDTVKRTYIVSIDY